MSASLMVSKVLLVAAGGVVGLPLSVLGLAVGERNPVGWLLAFVGMAYFFGGAVYLAIVGPEEGARLGMTDRSLWFVAPAFLVVFFGASLEYLLLPARLPRTETLQLAGLALIGLGGC